MSKCRTPGAFYSCRVMKPNAVGQTHAQMSVTIPPRIVISKTRAKAIEKAFHNAMEDVLANFWPRAAAGKEGKA